MQIKLKVLFFYLVDMVYLLHVDLILLFWHYICSNSVPMYFYGSIDLLFSEVILSVVL